MIKISKQRYDELIFIEQKLKQVNDSFNEEMKSWEEMGVEDSADFFKKHNL